MPTINDTAVAAIETAAFGDTGTNSNVSPVAVPSRKRAAKPAAKPTGKSAKAGKAAKPVKPSKRSAATVETPETDKRAERAERLAASRSTVADFYAAFEHGRASVPVKPISGFKLVSTTAHPIDRHPSMRQAAAICAAFAGSGVKLADGGKAERCFDSDGVASAIENGVLRDAVSSGMLRVSGSSPEAEKLTLTKSGLAYIVANIGTKALKAAKLL